MDMSDKKFWGDKPYFSLDHYLKQTFGEKVYRLSLNGGMTCPNRDGTLDSRGCIFLQLAGEAAILPLPLPLCHRADHAGEKKNASAGKVTVKSLSPIFRHTRIPTLPVSYLKRTFYGGDRTAGYCRSLHRNTL